jgi:hypothetical protein
MDQDHLAFAHVHSIERVGTCAFELSLNACERMRAEIIRRRDKPIIVVSRWKTTSVGNRPTGATLEFAAHRLTGMLDLLGHLLRATDHGVSVVTSSDRQASLCFGPADIANEHLQGRPFRSGDLDWRVANQVNVPALAENLWASYDFVLLDDVVFLPDRIFEFARYVRNEQPELAFTVVVRDAIGTPIDIAAWQPRSGRIATWLNRASMLGEDQLTAPRLSEGLPIFETPLQWLAQRRQGVVVIDAARAAPKLRDAAPLLAANYEHGKALRAMLKLKAPQILLPAPCDTGVAK